jgi:hypothetical protein
MYIKNTNKKYRIYEDGSVEMIYRFDFKGKKKKIMVNRILKPSKLNQYRLSMGESFFKVSMNQLMMKYFGKCIFSFMRPSKYLTQEEKAKGIRLSSSEYMKRYNANPENKKRHAQYLLDNKERNREKIRKSEKKARLTLSNNYVFRLLCNSTDIKREEIPQELINLKRKQLILCRRLRQITSQGLQQ